MHLFLKFSLPLLMIFAASLGHCDSDAEMGAKSFALPFVSLATDLTLSESPQFTYASSKSAFKAARAPTSVELIGTWDLVGQVGNPSLPGGISEGYWPDGKMTAPGQAFFA